jgi:hypothetical protein
MTPLGNVLPPWLARTAVISECGTYRYRLTRVWDADKSCVCWVMLNPSTADASKDDPTIRKCVGFSRRLGFGSIVVVNLFAFRATSPKDLRRTPGVGEGNDWQITLALKRSSTSIAAWGANGAYFPDRVREVCRLIREHSARPFCLGLTKGGQPLHPLMVGYDAKPKVFKGVKNA